MNQYNIVMQNIVILRSIDFSPCLYGEPLEKKVAGTQKERKKKPAVQTLASSCLYWHPPSVITCACFVKHGKQ